MKEFKLKAKRNVSIILKYTPQNTQIRWLWRTPKQQFTTLMKYSILYMSVSQILEVSELSGQSIRTLPPIPTCKNRKPTPGAGWFLQSSWNGKVYECIYMYIHIDTCYISYRKMIILSCPKNNDFAISIRFTGSPFVVFFVVGNDNVTYKNKCKNLPHKTILKGLLTIHTHTTISKKTWHKNDNLGNFCVLHNWWITVTFSRHIWCPAVPWN